MMGHGGKRTGPKKKKKPAPHRYSSENVFGGGNRGQKKKVKKSKKKNKEEDDHFHDFLRKLSVRRVGQGGGREAQSQLLSRKGKA